MNVSNGIYKLNLYILILFIGTYQNALELGNSECGKKLKTCLCGINAWLEKEGQF